MSEFDTLRRLDVATLLRNEPPVIAWLWNGYIERVPSSRFTVLAAPANPSSHWPLVGR
jgi:hypothetical protein